MPCMATRCHARASNGKLSKVADFVALHARFPSLPHPLTFKTHHEAPTSLPFSRSPELAPLPHSSPTPVPNRRRRRTLELRRTPREP